MFGMCRSTGMCLMIKDPDVPVNFNYFGTMENDRQLRNICARDRLHTLLFSFC